MSSCFRDFFSELPTSFHFNKLFRDQPVEQLQAQAALTASDAVNSSVTSTTSKFYSYSVMTQYKILITGKCPAGAEVSALKWSPNSV